MKTRYPLLAVTAAVAMVGACDTTEPRVPTTVQVDPQSVSMEVGETASIQAVVLDQDGRAFDVPPEGFEIAWSTSASSVATVSNGTITAVGGGDAVIRAQAGGLAAAEVDVMVQARTVTAQIGFSYSGDRSGSFSLEETFPLDNVGTDWAITFFVVDDGQDFTDVFAHRTRADGLVDFLWFWVAGHVSSTGTRSAGGVLYLGWDIPEDTMENIYIPPGPGAGSVNHTTATSTRLAGTFTLDLEEAETGESLSITDGTFDLPLVLEEEVFGSMVAAEAPQTVVIQEALHQIRQAHRR